MPAKISFFDMEVSVTPPGGFNQPVPVTLGANWQPNDIRTFFVAGAGKASSGETLAVPMTSNPPTGFTTAYSYDPTGDTQGVFYESLISSSVDSSVAFPKPPNWLYYMFATLTARGVNPAVAPVAGKLGVTFTAGSGVATVASVTVPAAGTMVMCLGTLADPFGGYLSWPLSVGIPTGWTPLVATDKSGATYYSFDTNPALALVGKSFSTSGSTGSVVFPTAVGSAAMLGMYAFFQPAPDVSVTIGAA